MYPIAAEQLENSRGSAYEAITYHRSKPPHNSGLH